MGGQTHVKSCIWLQWNWLLERKKTNISFLLGILAKLYYQAENWPLEVIQIQFELISELSCGVLSHFITGNPDYSCISLIRPEHFIITYSRSALAKSKLFS